MRAIGWLVLMVVLTGCVSMSNDPGVDVALVDVRVSGATLWETTAEFVVRIDNEAPEPVVLDGAVHKIFLNGRYVGKGLSNERVEIPRLSSTTHAITVHLRNLSMAARVRELIEGRALDYRMESVVYLASGMGRRGVRTLKEGTLDPAMGSTRTGP